MSRTFLVGGAVRDSLLDRPVHERDWVVVGSDPETMLANGFRPVGKDFPVFLHPQTQEEYALARTERKSGRGYHGFAFHAAADVTLEEDLQRRDFTVNAIARDDDGTLIDPYGGADDLKARVLRHVSPAFVEDPLRVLRAARFMAELAPWSFHVADETLAVMRSITDSGELDTLAAERLWQETRRALLSPAPQRYFETLRACGALAVLFPEIEALFGVPQPPKHHPEVDCGVHLMMVLQQSARLEHPPEVRFAALCHDLGKAVTPDHVLPSHRGHEAAGVPLVEQLCDRLKVPNPCRELARVVTREHLHAHRALELRPETVQRLFSRMDAYRRPERVRQFVQACEADSRGRTGFEDREYPQADYLLALHDAAAGVGTQAIAEAGFSGPEFGQELARRRTHAIADEKQRLTAG